MKLSYKIFTASLLVSFILIFTIMATVKFFAHRHFEEIQAVMIREMATILTHKLAAEYQKHGNWDSLTMAPGTFKTFVKTALHGTHDLFPIPRPPFASEKKVVLPYERIALFSAEKTRIAGPEMKSSALVFKPIDVRENRVGWIGFGKLKHLPPPFEKTFFKARLRVLYTIGVLAFILSGVVSYVLSRHILSPVDKLTRGTSALTRHEFDTRIEVETGDELGQLADHFNQMAKTLEAYESARKQWVMDISHELRAPLSVLRGETEAMIDGLRPLSIDQVQVLHDEMCYLEKIVDDLHFLSKADTGSLHMVKKKISPGRILKKTAALYAPALNEKKLRLSLLVDHPEKMIWGDAGRLKQLFSNLFDNHVKYTDKPGRIRIRDRVEGNRLLITFRDTGPGVPPHCLDKLFDRLYRVDPSRDRGQTGSGLGLSLCKIIAQAHDGEISAENRSPRGLGITLALPLG